MVRDGKIDLERDIMELSGKLEMFYFDSMFYTGISICQSSSNYAFNIYASQSRSVLPQKNKY